MSTCRGGPQRKGFLGNDDSKCVGGRMPVLAPAPSLGVSFGHGVRSRSPAAGPSADRWGGRDFPLLSANAPDATTARLTASQMRVEIALDIARFHDAATALLPALGAFRQPPAASFARAGVHVELWNCGTLAPEYQ